MSLITLPLSPNAMFDLFQTAGSKERNTLTVDYKNSELKSDDFINYIVNMKLDCNIAADPSITYEEKEELLLAFSDHRYSSICDTLLYALATIMLRSRNVTDLSYSDFLSEEEIAKFIQHNPEVIQETSEFIDSMLIVLPAFNVDFKENTFKPLLENGIIETVEKYEIGPHALGLLTIPDFIEFFIAANPNEPTKFRYFKELTEAVMFRGQSIFEILGRSETPNATMAFINVLFSSEEDEQEIKNKYFAVGA